MPKIFVLTEEQSGYDIVGEYIKRYWENVCYTTVIVSVSTSYDEKNYHQVNIVASPTNELEIEYLHDWWEGQKHIILNGIMDIEKVHVYGGIFEPIKSAKVVKIQKDLPEEVKSLIYIGFSSHDCESWYKCPYCDRAIGSWSFPSSEEIRRGIKLYCPRCKKELKKDR